MTNLWSDVARKLGCKLGLMDEAQAAGETGHLNRGQIDSLRALAGRLPQHGVIVADEVGMGKTRIATELTETVTRCGGRVAILMPAGLGFQWKRELSDSRVTAEDVMRSVVGFGQGLVDSGNGPGYWSQNVVLISHAFGKWRIKAAAHPARWCLLPAAAAVWQDYGSSTANRRRESSVERLGEHGVAALRTAHAIKADPAVSDWPWHQDFAEFCGRVKPGSLMDPGNYGVGSEHRKWLYRVVGLAMGRFDLVVIDEAHKSRGDDSSLSLLLKEILWLAPSARRLAMTATPVELDPEQWIQSLDRIGVHDVSNDIRKAIESYRDALSQIRTQWRTNESARTDFSKAARQFQEALGCYVLRRDKNSGDEAVMLFRQHGGDLYRDTGQAVAIDIDELAPPWRRALCAAESLSIIQVPQDHATKRLRLTFASGHGSSAFMDSRGWQPESADEAAITDPQAAEGESTSNAQTVEGHVDDFSAKRRDRQQWWRDRLEDALRQVPDSRFEHPAVEACVRAIERRTSNGDKVLVFGTYVEPMRRLVELLNARQMLRSLSSGDYWPQSGLGSMSNDVDFEFPVAVDVAYHQWEEEHGEPYPIPRAQLNDKLKQQFDAEHGRREAFRQSVIANVRQGLSELKVSASARSLFEDMERAATADGGGTVGAIALVARALLDQTGGMAPEMMPRELAGEFLALADATLDEDQQDAASSDDDSYPNDDVKAQRWVSFLERLTAEASTQMGGFARLMYGGTSTDSRRRIQQSFNRSRAYPRVVVAQSRVGREGLNLHQACSVVMLMHPEWNPAVVEQQIGRVDRVDSLWSRRLRKAVESGERGDRLPRIEVLPVIFRGTYDEHQWRVLNDRWADLRAQLHGEVIPPSMRPACPTQSEYEAMDFLQRAAPRFSQP